jgi:hypothetical protein
MWNPILFMCDVSEAFFLHDEGSFSRLESTTLLTLKVRSFDPRDCSCVNREWILPWLELVQVFICYRSDRACIGLRESISIEDRERRRSLDFWTGESCFRGANDIFKS